MSVQRDVYSLWFKERRGVESQDARLENGKLLPYYRVRLTLTTDENAKMTDCYYEKKDWRACAKEASPSSAGTSNNPPLTWRGLICADQLRCSRRWRSLKNAGNVMATMRGPAPKTPRRRCIIATRSNCNNKE
ncbi:hypothetical protein HDV57DRAFT_205505 [Trichoderma longibrachiatum]